MLTVIFKHRKRATLYDKFSTIKLKLRLMIQREREREILELEGYKNIFMLLKIIICYVFVSFTFFPFQNL